ncbi:unnamed protein product [Rotaria magnacalcarata]|uniref:Uncharacterized protein n=1 Tax=Rotaria magnacalcarata TaxID=392030 RepID=A0A816KXG8_9BILA|nr:unnamed protein product [Rotaria magnacalcarata]
MNKIKPFFNGNKSKSFNTLFFLAAPSIPIQAAPSIPIPDASSTPTPSVSICAKTFAFVKNISMSERLYQWLTGKPKVHTKVE